MKIIRDRKHLNMYRVRWPNGDISISTDHPEMKGGHYGFYNKTRAKEFLHRKGVNNYILDQTYNAPMARLEAR